MTRATNQDPQNNIEPLAALLKAAADPLRLTILRILQRESYGVQELTYIFDMIQSRMSHHLKVLARAGLVSTRKEGTYIFYRRPLIDATEPHRVLKTGLFTTIDAMPVPADISKRLVSVREERDQSSRAFFSKNADRFREKQDLIVTYAQYEGCLKDLVSSVTLPAKATLLEVGPGSGELLFNLAGQFAAVYALDNSHEMLANTQKQMEDRQMNHINYLCGDPNTALERGLSVDMLVLNMVLHHMASPSAAFDTCAKLLSNNGVILIADLNAHSQEWVRQTCGDLWLGFPPDDLADWAVSANLNEGQSVFLGLKNGFGVQMRLFHKK